ncbi:hypothetical protein [Nocardioides sp. YIM 152588]|uniref:hypothetical protein n=1 Tax=Nocardioides sp. YIM 152588 TaxID=3158259 RepID=UPI0032E50D70
MKKSLAASAVLSTSLTSVALVAPALPAAAADQTCTADSVQLIEVVPAVTHTESQYSKTVTVPAVGSPTKIVDNPDYVPATTEVVQHPAEYATVVVEREFTKTTPGTTIVHWFKVENAPDEHSEWTPTGNVRTEEREVKAAWEETVAVPAQGEPTIEVANPDHVPASVSTVYYNGKVGGTTDPAQAAWVRYTPTGWPQVVDTRTVTDAPESYVCDFEKPVTTLTNGSALVRPGYAFRLTSTDNDRVVRTVGNVYQDGALFKSFQAAGDALEVPVTFADGTYTLRYNSKDAAGNIATTGNFTFVVDGTAPTVTDKGTEGAVAQAKSFKLFDVNKVDKVVINGVTKDLTDNKWSDVNDIRPGVFGAVEGTNTMEVYDVAGNVTTVTFTLDNEGPTVTDKGTEGAVAQAKSFKLFDANKVDKVVINGVTKDLTDNKWSDVNDIRPGVFGAVEGTNTMEVYDVAGNVTTVTFVLDTTGPAITEKEGSSAAARSFSLDDLELGSGVAGVRINGVDYPLTVNRWSDVNDLIDGNFWGALAGENTLVAYDALGNETTVTFTLDASVTTGEADGGPDEETTTPGSDGSEPGASDDATDGDDESAPEGDTSESDGADESEDTVESDDTVETDETDETTDVEGAEEAMNLPPSLPATGGDSYSADQAVTAAAAQTGGTSSLPLIGAGLMVLLAGAGAGALARLVRR